MSVHPSLSKSATQTPGPNSSRLMDIPLLPLKCLNLIPAFSVTSLNRTWLCVCARRNDGATHVSQMETHAIAARRIAFKAAPTFRSLPTEKWHQSLSYSQSHLPAAPGLACSHGSRVKMHRPESCIDPQAESIPRRFCHQRIPCHLKSSTARAGRSAH